MAAFDFDGTLTRGDTLLPFLKRLCGTRAVTVALAASSVSVGRAFRAGIDRDALKVAVLARLLAGRPLRDVEAVAGTYSELVVRRRLRRDMLERVTWHRDQGHDLVVVSASPEAYVGPVARRLGIDAVVATRLETDDAGCLTGRLLGANVRGPEKVARLHAHLGDGPVTLWAYGDSAGDRELLARADMAFTVTRRGIVLAAGPRPPAPPTRRG